MADVGNSQRPSRGSSGETLTRTQAADRKTNAAGPAGQAGPVERAGIADARSRRGERSVGGRARRQCGLLILFIRVSLHQFHDPIGVVATLAYAVNDLRDPEVEYGIDNHA